MSTVDRTEELLSVELIRVLECIFCERPELLERYLASREAALRGRVEEERPGFVTTNDQR